MNIDLPFLTRTLNSLKIRPLDVRPNYSAQSLLRKCQEQRHYHAEIQILVELEKASQTEPSSNIFPYLGISKKTCFLCGEISASFPFYQNPRLPQEDIQE